MGVRGVWLVLTVAFVAGAALSPAAVAQEVWQQAYQAYERKNYPEAERLFRQVVEQYPEWGWAHMMLGITLAERSRNREALSELQTAKELVSQDEERFQVNHAIAQVYLKQRQYDRAIAAENEAGRYATSGSERGLVAKTLGKAYYFKDDWRSAIRHLERAAQARASDAEVHAMLGRAYYETDQTARALETLGKALQLDRDNRTALYFVGLIHIEQGRYRDAVRVAEQAIRTDPQDLAIRNLLGRAYLGAQRFEDAIQAFQVVVQERPSDGTAHYNLGQAHQFVENYGKATEEYLAALRYLPADSAARAECLYDLGFVYEKVGRYEDALGAYQDSAAIRQADKVAEAIARVQERIRRARESSPGS